MSSSIDFLAMIKAEFESRWQEFVVHMKTTPDLKEVLMEEIGEWYRRAIVFEVGRSLSK